MIMPTGTVVYMVTELDDVLTSIDVAAHEIGHAVCEKNNKLSTKRIRSNE
jgi:Zn-dependent membrane protease YugP